MTEHRLAIGYVHDGRPTHAFMDSVIALKDDPRFRTIRIAKRSGPLIAGARNEVVAAFLTTNASHLLFADTDVAFRPAHVEALFTDKLPIVSGLYYGTHEDGLVFPVGTIRNDGSFRRMHEHDFDEDERPTLVAGVGMGFCLIERDVLRTLAVRALWPFRETLIDGQPCGEDVTFCVRAAEAGYPSYIDPRVRVRHVKEAVL